MDTDDDIDDFQIESSLRRIKVKTVEYSSNQPDKLNTVLIDILPDEYEYKVLQYDLTKSSEVAGENQFSLECRINIHNSNEWNEWFNKFCSKSGTSYNRSRQDAVGTGKKVILSGYRKCIHNVKYYKSKRQCVQQRPLKGKGPGRKTGEDRVPGKQTLCEAKLSFQLAGNKLYQSKSSSSDKCLEALKFPMLLKMSYVHNHSINSSDALRYRPIGENAKEKLKQLFLDGHSPSSAYQAFKDELAKMHGDEFTKVSADRSIMPDYFYVYHFHAEHMKVEYGTINGVDSYQRAVAKIDEYNIRHGETLAKIAQNDDGETCVAICDAFNHRCHEHLPQAEQSQ